MVCFRPHTDTDLLPRQLERMRICEWGVCVCVCVCDGVSVVLTRVLSDGREEEEAMRS